MGGSEEEGIFCGGEDVGDVCSYLSGYVDGVLSGLVWVPEEGFWMWVVEVYVVDEKHEDSAICCAWLLKEESAEPLSVCLL